MQNVVTLENPPTETRELSETVYVGLSRYDEGTVVRCKPVHVGTRDECVWVTFPRGEGSYLRSEQVR